MAPPQWLIITELAEWCPTLASVQAHASSDAHALVRDFVIKPYPMRADPVDGCAEKMALTMPGDEQQVTFLRLWLLLLCPLWLFLVCPPPSLHLPLNTKKEKRRKHMYLSTFIPVRSHTHT